MGVNTDNTMSHGRDTEKHAFSYMDGVAVKISEKYKPPRKVVLPLGFQHRFPAETEDEEYDFTLERSVLVKMAEWRKLRQAAVAARKERIKAQDAALEEKLSKRLEDFTLGPSAAEDEITPSSGSSCQTYSSSVVSSTPIAYPNSVYVPSSSVIYSNSSSTSVSYSVDNSTSVISDQNQQQCLPNTILTPVPISYISNEIGLAKGSSHFNFSDFEADTSSPFDNMELKTINEMEELAHVLQPASNSPPDNNKNESPSSSVTLSNNYSSPTSPYNLNQTITYYNTIGYKPVKESGIPSHINGYNLYGTEHRVRERKSRNENYINLGSNVSEYSSNMQQEMGNLYYYPDQPWQVDNTSNSSPAGDIKLKVIDDEIGKRFDYTSDLSFPSTYNHRSSSNQDREASSRSLSRSVPDIVEELEKELSAKRLAETNAVAAARTSHTPPPRPNSFGSTGLENWKPWPDLDSPEQTQSKGKVKKSPVSSLPNPFHKLSPSGQHLTRHISEMGFALPRVARACVELGEDGKKMVEFLLHVQSLEETWPGDMAEKAMLLNKCDYPQAVKFLEAMTQLLDLGFPEDKVSEALLMFGSDRDKALDHIIS